MKNQLLLNYMAAKNRIIYEFYYSIRQVQVNNLNYPMVLNLRNKRKKTNSIEKNHYSSTRYIVIR